MRTDIVSGAVFPDYELTDHTGKRRKLSDLQGPDPMILVAKLKGHTVIGSAGGAANPTTILLTSTQR